MADPSRRVAVSAVQFPGFGGVTLRGDLYLPAAPAAAGLFPAVVMAHGFSATRRMGLAGFAEAFAAEGYAVLAYDHRCLGDSDGEPRQEINPWAQARDYRYALSWLVDHPAIDADRLGVWGSSFSGGEVLVVAAVDDRVRAVIANVPFAGFSTSLDPAERIERFAALRAALEDESGAGPADSAEPVIGPLPVIIPTGGAPDTPAFLSQPESTVWFEQAGDAASGWRNTFTLRGLTGAQPFDPALAMPFIAPAALLMVVAAGDRVAPAQTARDAYEIAAEPKQLELLDGHHFVPYGGEAFERASAVMCAFLRRHL